MTRLQSANFGWATLIDKIEISDTILRKQRFLRHLQLTSFGTESANGRLKSAPQIDRVISICGGHLSSLQLDGLNLVKCPETFALIVTTCSRLKSLSLRGAHLFPKSSPLLTSLRSLEALYWDFGNAQLSARQRSVEYDLEVIRTMSTLTSLGVCGGAGLGQVFPTLHDVLEGTRPVASFLPLLNEMNAKLPPGVGVRNLVFMNEGSFLGTAMALGHSPQLLSELISHGCHLDSFPVGFDMRSVSPLWSMLLGWCSPYSFLRYVPPHNALADRALAVVQVIKLLWTSGASLVDLFLTGPKGPDQFKGIVASNFFAAVALTSLSRVVDRFVFSLSSTTMRFQPSYLRKISDMSLESS